MDQISARVDRLSETVYGSSAPQRSTPAESGSRSWADRTRSPTPRRPLRSDDEEEDTGNGGNLVNLSEADHRLVKNAFLASIPNDERRRLRNQFPTSAVPQTRCPRLDPVFKASLAKAQDVKALDRELARVQALVHDAVGPLLHLLTGVESEGLSVYEAQSTVRDALWLVGNTSANLSELRRKRIGVGTLKSPEKLLQYTFIINHRINVHIVYTTPLA